MTTRHEALSLRRRLLLTSLALIVASGAATEAFLIPRLSHSLGERIRADLFHRASLIADRIEPPPAAETPLQLEKWDALADSLGKVAGGRVTLIAAGGLVIGDSYMLLGSLPATENQAASSEVRDALDGRPASGTRLSETLGERMLYAAVPWRGSQPKGGPAASATDGSIENRGAVRIGVPLAQVEQTTNEVRRVLFLGALLGMGAAVLLSSLAVRWIAGPIEELARIAERIDRGDLSTRIRTGGGKELTRLGRTLEVLVEDLSRVSEARRRERDLLSAILEGMREGILVLDAQRRILTTNSALREFFGAGPDVVGKTTLEAFRCLPLENTIGQAFEAPQGIQREFEVDGPRRFTLLAHGSRVSSAPEAPALVVLHDVTDLRRLETMRRDFVASASHELRTPVATIRGAAEALEEEDLGLSTDARPFAEIVRRHAEQLSQLVDDLLDLSRIESGTFEPLTEEIDVRSALESTAAAFGEAAGKRGMRLKIEVPADMPPVLADRRALRQVLQNLVDNATKYARESAAIILRARTDGDAAVIAVEDDGPGIEARHLPRLFERFYRVEVSRSRALGGTGLGLAIVKHLVETMGGEVSVESAPGRGTTFRFTLPLAVVSGSR